MPGPHRRAWSVPGWRRRCWPRRSVAARSAGAARGDGGGIRQEVSSGPPTGAVASRSRMRSRAAARYKARNARLIDRLVVGVGQSSSNSARLDQRNSIRRARRGLADKAKNLGPSAGKYVATKLWPASSQLASACVACSSISRARSRSASTAASCRAGASAGNSSTERSAPARRPSPPSRLFLPTASAAARAARRRLVGRREHQARGARDQSGAPAPE